MEEFVRKVLSRYTSFVSEKQLYERWLDMRENSDVREALVMTDMKITMIQSWFNLLNADERFVIEKHLLDELEWPRVAFSFTKKWDGEFTRTERSLVTYQASGLKKIISFVELFLISHWLIFCLNGCCPFRHFPANHNFIRFLIFFQISTNM